MASIARDGHGYAGAAKSAQVDIDNAAASGLSRACARENMTIRNSVENAGDKRISRGAKR